jgi:hypothetical protein
MNSLPVQKTNNQTKNSKEQTGIALAYGDITVKPRITYREVTLIIGIMVAIIVVFTVWLKQKPANLNSSEAITPWASKKVVVTDKADAPLWRSAVTYFLGASFKAK